MSMRIAVATAIGCFAALPLLGLGPAYVSRAAGVQKPPPPPPPFATLINLPTLNGGPAEPYGINDAGTVIVGYSNGRPDSRWAVTWTLQGSKWVISKLPAPVPLPFAQRPAASTPLATSSGTSLALRSTPSSGPLKADRLCSAATAMSEKRMRSARTAKSLSGTPAFRRRYGPRRGPAPSSAAARSRRNRGGLRRHG